MVSAPPRKALGRITQRVLQVRGSPIQNQVPGQVHISHLPTALVQRCLPIPVLIVDVHTARVDQKLYQLLILKRRCEMHERIFLVLIISKPV